MAIIRDLLGRIILLLDWLFTPKSIKRDPELQAQLDLKMANYTLYQYLACPFCVKVRRALKRNSLLVETRDAKRCETTKKELLEGGGKLKVPCLRIEGNDGSVSWLYQSSDIIHYLEAQIPR